MSHVENDSDVLIFWPNVTSRYRIREVLSCTLPFLPRIGVASGVLLVRDRDRGPE